MIHIFRKYILRGMVLLSLTLTLLLLLWVGLYYKNFYWQEWLGDYIWWGLKAESLVSPPIKLALLLVFLVLGPLGGGYLYRQVSRVPAVALIFFSLFVLSLSLQFLRITYLADLKFLSSLSPVLIARVIYFGKFFAILSLFTASLFSLGLATQYFGISLTLIFIIAFSLAGDLSFSQEGLSGSFMPLVLEREDMFIVTYLIEGITALNYFIAGIKKGQLVYHILAAAIVAIFLGYELLFFLHPISFVPALLLYGLGSFLYIRSNKTLFLWS